MVGIADNSSSAAISDSKGGCVQVPKSAKELLKVLVEANLPITDSEGFKALVAIEGKAFPQAVVDLVEGLATGETAEYVRTILTAVATSTREVLNGWGYVATPVALLDVAKREISSFRETFEQAAVGDDSSRMYFVDLLSQYDALEATVAMEKPTPAKRTTKLAEADSRAGVPPVSGAKGQRLPDIDSAEQRYGESYRVYASSAALCVCECSTKADQKPTVMFETAKKESTYDWKNKRCVMLTQGEVPLVLGVFLGYLSKVDIVGHGKKQEKWMTIEDQKHQIYVKTTFRGESPRGVPVPPATAAPVIAMLMKQFQANYPYLSEDALLLIVRRVSEMYTSTSKEI